MEAGDVIIIGAGPAGLTAAYELLKSGAGRPIIYESESFIGGISRTYDFQGNKMDMGGHRFFSKSDIVMDWWKELLPIQGMPAKDDLLLNRGRPLFSETGDSDPEKEDAVMLCRTRLSRIYFLRSFFCYPASLGLDTLRGLGLWRLGKIGLSYLQAMAFPRREENTLEDYMINRFGKELYLTFFKDYTEKVWGTPCHEIPADWGAQRIKGVSISKVLIQAVSRLFKQNSASPTAQKNVETSLIEQFLYPKYGPGQMWEEVARRIVDMGGELHLNSRIIGMRVNNSQVMSVEVQNANNIRHTREAKTVISSMPVKDLLVAMGDSVPSAAAEVAQGLKYRAFRTVGLLVRKLKIKNKTNIATLSELIPDTWIYIQEREVKLGRLQIFNNWSPYLLKDFENSIWLGLEYFCDESENDELWQMPDDVMCQFAASELAQIGIIDHADVLTSCSVRVPKAYPAYFGTYARFSEIRQFTDTIKNLYLVGRNGMHRYNNMDHSMLTAMAAVQSILRNGEARDKIWDINTEMQYHESKNSPPSSLRQR